MADYLKKKFEKKSDIYSFDISDFNTQKVTEFYKKTPFPNYRDDDNKQTILEKGNKNILAKQFKKFIGYQKKILEVGCGTGQLSIFFSINTNNEIVGLDPTKDSLKLAKKINGEEKLKYNLAASFQKTINKILYKKTKVAVEMFREKTKKENFQLIVAGGVAANETIRKNLSTLSNEKNFETVYPDLKFCGDNAAMIAWAGIQRFKKNMIDDVNVSAKSRWPLDENAPYMKGPGLKL